DEVFGFGGHTPALPSCVARRRRRHHAGRRRPGLSAVASRHRSRGDSDTRSRTGLDGRVGPHEHSAIGASAAMNALTLANQLTLLRMLLIPAFVIFVIYGQLGYALLVFVLAGVTDAFDGLLARAAHQKTSLGAWLDPMADKLLLVSTFVVLSIPGLGLANRLPVWLTVCMISRDVVIILTVIIVNLAIGPKTFLPTSFGK